MYNAVSLILAWMAVSASVGLWIAPLMSDGVSLEAEGEPPAYASAAMQENWNMAVRSLKSISERMRES